jgi:hypothetical protein
VASPERIYHGSIRIFSLIFVVLGVIILISTIAQGGGPLSLGVMLGIAFLAVGILRGWLGGWGPPWRRTKSEHRGEGRRDRTRGQAGRRTRGRSLS